jgi:hypothetical protein
MLLEAIFTRCFWLLRDDHSFRRLVAQYPSDLSDGEALQLLPA